MQDYGKMYRESFLTKDVVTVRFAIVSMTIFAGLIAEFLFPILK